MRTVLQHIHGAFFRFATWMQRIIASPEHLALFLLTMVIWSAWAISRSFDSLSQLSINTPTTVLEYLFEILILAAACAAGAKADAILAQLIELVADVKHLIENVITKEDAIIVELRQDVAELTTKLDTLIATLAQREGGS